MTMIYHILGSNIPHHNQTVLGFFQNELLPKFLPKEESKNHQFWVVGESSLQTDYPHLALKYFSTKKQIANELIQLAKSEQDCYFLFHGQFNHWIWLAILFKQLPSDRCIWHIWGADLYEESTQWQFKLFYPLRRFAQKQLFRIWGTLGDLKYAHQNLKRNTELDRLVYFPTRLPSETLPSTILPCEQSAKRDRKLTILVGNSGDSSNQHILALRQIKQSLGLGEQIKLILPMGYPANNHRYIELVEQTANELFPLGVVDIIKEKMDFNDYLSLLAKCDLGYFNFKRQQGIGTICLLIQENIPVVLDPQNPFLEDMQASGISFLTTDHFSVELIEKKRQDLANIDKTRIPFFPSNYLTHWLHNLAELG
ncbi:TDP-N-acetylfucosamine:lipid II N-acetylfucosaminyltransferase [Otariodibacter oris]|uniref:dTDP-N-acetylfucosamine:lipid II N-acetylfucosaminyltransferase n=1 Tax=Otariodibacter oris TaxID=1032623 RepID=A0A420XEG9_9PAST|nr:TDP-N-acetylfucosamine:lipid II N-acetylfucosaminyltransferase [Otariodibacter oris]QGM80160.1 hypothetical protein A6A10_01425 [Otariodibacter oris]RKR70509.1 dTDP-N-acetylfucosamine:lipid II N-acetylfucosaminyltransferase [Otariodibacter oris]